VDNKNLALEVKESHYGLESGLLPRFRSEI
jgi:hypothetical protein